MNICFTANEKFIPQFEVTLTSILETADKEDAFSFFLITDGLKNKTKEYLTKRYPMLNILEININDKIRSYPLISNDSYIVYLRLQIPSLLPNIKKVLYLDCDIIANRSLKPLYSTDINNYYAAGIPDIGVSTFLPKHIEKLGIKEYFNAGVLLMNLEEFRHQNIEEKCYEFLQKNNSITFQDQDVLNVVCANHIKPLDTSFNSQTEKGFKTSEHLKPETIIHYAGQKKPWNSVSTSKNWLLYWKYVFKTKYFAHFLKLWSMAILKNFKIFFKYALKRV